MKISYNWLKKYVKTDIPPEDAARLLTDVGLEVEAIEPFESIKGGLQNVVIGEVITCNKHPNADRLSLTTVDVGGEALQIICGAPNVQVGQKVVVAVQGAVLYPVKGEPFTIKKSNIRGQNSEGMICAEDEIGLGSSHEGIMVLPTDTPVGMAAAEYFHIYSDTVFEINITPNRADAISHLGVARDLAAAIKMAASKNAGQAIEIPILNIPAIAQIPAGNGFSIQVEVKSAESCPRYSGITLTGVKVRQSPLWLKNYLLAVSMRPINNIVDVTNYVMLETGQPLHAFDADTITGKKIIVRNAEGGETITTLDGILRNLQSSDLLICNEKRTMCIAGVYGGMDSGVTDSTSNIFIESACFSPPTIRKTARNMGLHTDSAYRFERGTDINGTLFALHRAVQLIMETGGGTIASEITDIFSTKSFPDGRKPGLVIDLSLEYVRRLTGCTIHGDEIEDIFSPIGIKVIESKADLIRVEVPTFRMDIACQTDLIEEILRFYGLNNIPIGPEMKLPVAHHSLKSSGGIWEETADMLSVSGFTEIMTTSLTSSSSQKQLSSDKKDAFDRDILLANPLSTDLDVLRSNLLGNGLQAIAFNQNHRHSDIRFYEYGKTYHRKMKSEEKIEETSSPFIEEEHVGLWIAGSATRPHWKIKPLATDFYYLKSYVKRIVERIAGNAKLQEKNTENRLFQYGLLWFTYSASADKSVIPIVEFGLVSRNIAESRQVKGEVFYADFHWGNLLNLVSRKIEVKEVSRFPAVVRDLSLVIDRDIEFRKLQELAFRSERNLLREISIIDVYEGDKVEAGKKSYTLRFVLQNESKTLTDAEIDLCMDNLMDTYGTKAGAVVRKG